MINLFVHLLEASIHIMKSKSLLLLVIKQGFVTSVLLTLRTGSFFVLGGCPVHCRMFTGILGFLAEACSISPIGTTEKHLQIFPRGKNW